MALSDAKIRAAKPGDRDRKLADEKGLYLLVTMRGSKLWRMKYRFLGKEKKLALASFSARDILVRAKCAVRRSFIF